MNKEQILEADYLDILFEGRNKEYGAYQLRKHYNRTMIKAMLGTGSIIVFLFVGYLIGNLRGKSKQQEVIVADVQLEDVKEEKKLPPPPAKPKLDPPKIAIIKFTPPKIVPDDKVKVEEKPPEQEKVEEFKIGDKTQEGVKDEGIIAPPVSDAGKGVAEAPKDNTDYDQTFTKVEIESEYPGGKSAWLRYLNKNFVYPQEAVDNNIQGIVIVQFIVDKEGLVSDVEVVEGPEELKAESIRVIKKSGKWKPAVQNGRAVRSYKKQPIVFKMESQ